jgi:hypothetical protein
VNQAIQTFLFEHSELVSDIVSHIRGSQILKPQPPVPREEVDEDVVFPTGHAKLDALRSGFRPAEQEV